MTNEARVTPGSVTREPPGVGSGGYGRLTLICHRTPRHGACLAINVTVSSHPHPRSSGVLTSFFSSLPSFFLFLSLSVVVQCGGRDSPSRHLSYRSVPKITWPLDVGEHSLARAWCSFIHVEIASRLREQLMPLMVLWGAVIFPED